MFKTNDLSVNITNIFENINRLSTLVGFGEFLPAYKGAITLLEKIERLEHGDEGYYLAKANIAAVFIDVGGMLPSEESSLLGLNILESYKTKIIELIGESDYFYNLSNAKSNLVGIKNPFEQTFDTVEEHLAVKNDLWKAIKLSKQQNKQAKYTFIVNLGNTLKQQFRISEALKCYDSVNTLKLDVPQAWINRSVSLVMLNTISSTYTVQMFKQIIEGYIKARDSQVIPSQWKEFYQSQVSFFQLELNKITNVLNIKNDEHDEAITQKEYQALSDYRKFCLEQYLTLSEHGLYCKCAGSARDNLTIPTNEGIVGDFIIPMEMVLNRAKSEFSLARRMYYECLVDEEFDELTHESCFSELHNDELLGINVEKMRTAFRLCFGVLDKIAVAICELFDVYPPNKNVSFQSFWQLDRDDRRNKFNKIKNPGLLALYSIATDLNEKKDGEWAFLKSWRNDLEHKFLVVHKNECPNDMYKSYGFSEEIVFIKEGEFIYHLEQLFQITRSAIFSFVFAVRDKAISEHVENGIYIPMPIDRKNFI